eukprot:scaffold37804_cov67-Phaeocystis_antarctica.AAC.3
MRHSSGSDGGGSGGGGGGSGGEGGGSGGDRGRGCCGGVLSAPAGSRASEKEDCWDCGVAAPAHAPGAALATGREASRCLSRVAPRR